MNIYIHDHEMNFERISVPDLFVNNVLNITISEAYKNVHMYHIEMNAQT